MSFSFTAWFLFTVFFGLGWVGTFLLRHWGFSLIGRIAAIALVGSYFAFAFAQNLEEEIGFAAAVMVVLGFLVDTLLWAVASRLRRQHNARPYRQFSDYPPKLPPSRPSNLRSEIVYDPLHHS